MTSTSRCGAIAALTRPLGSMSAPRSTRAGRRGATCHTPVAAQGIGTQAMIARALNARGLTTPATAVRGPPAQCRGCWPPDIAATEAAATDGEAHASLTVG